MAKSDREKAQHGPENLPEPHVVDPDEVVLAGAEAGAGPSAAEPELSISADELTLAKPELAPAVISKDAAETVALDEAAGEARAAAEEAAEAGVLAAGPVPRDAPAVQAEPAGTAPAGGAAGDASGTADTSGTAGDTAGAAAGDSPGATSAPPAGDAPADPAGPDTGQPAGGTHGTAPHPGATDPSGAKDEPDTTETGTTGIPAGSDPTDAAGDIHGVSLVPVLSGAGGQDLYAGTDPAAVGSAPAVPPAAAGGRTGSSAVSATNRPSVEAPPAGPAAAAPVSAPARSPWAPAGESAPAVGPRRARSQEQRGAKPRPLVPLILGAVAVLALLAWGIVSVVRGLAGGGDPQTVQIPTTAGADGVIAENVAPSVLTAGQCLLDFTGISNEVTIVTCTTPHRAQLIASEFYPDEAEFPGRDQLGARAKAACDAADINTEAAAAAGRIELLHVTPTEGTWADEDRRVDCFAVVEEGATLSRSLLNE